MHEPHVVLDYVDNLCSFLIRYPQSAKDLIGNLRPDGVVIVETYAVSNLKRTGFPDIVEQG